MKKRKRLTAALSAVSLLACSLQPVPALTASAADHPDYAKALQMSLYFYECQQAGKLPEWNRVEWRADSTVDDVLNGGWYDAGDHVKFNLPMSYSASMVAWGLYAYPDGIEQAGEMTNYVNNLKWVLDYLAACDLGDEVIFQVGIGQKDHSWWGPAELLEYGMADQGITGARDYLKGRDCSAVTAEMGAALAAGYCALQGRVDDAVLADYLDHAKNYFDMADADRSDDTYNASDAKGFYQSRHFYDELFWCANWLYIATKDQAYLDKAKSYIPDLGKEQGQSCLKYSWAHCWDDTQQGGSLLYAMNTGDAEWKAQVKKHLDYWLTSKDTVPGGLIYVQNWGCLRHANTFAFVAAVACDNLFKDDPDYEKYVKLYETQVNFALGVNPTKQNYVVGYAENSPRNTHHRTAHASWKNSTKDPVQNRHILYGALVGGPNQDGSYEDDRNNYINNEVATDYNAGYTAMLCKMLSVYGGKSDPAFPYAETRDDEFYVEAKIKSDASGSTVSMKMTNHSAWPARIVDNLSMRYYMDLSEIVEAGVSPEDLVLRVDRDQSAMYEGVKPAVVSKPTKYKDNIYYVEVTFPDGRAIMPVSEGQQQCEILLALVYPNYGSGWDATNDYSAQDLGTDDNEKTVRIPVYENGVLIFGEEPDGTKGTGSISAAAPPDGKSDIVTTEPVVTTTTTKTTESATTTSTTTTSASSPNPAPKNKYGDINEDDAVDVKDAVLLARIAGGDRVESVTAQGKNNADVVVDGRIDTADLTALLRCVVGIISESELGKTAT